ncbi:MAG: nuclear transport factor 2 family protein [Actinomycetota bacterium]
MSGALPLDQDRANEHAVGASTRDVVAMCGAALLAGDRDALNALLDNDVVALIPGRHRLSGLHRGPAAVSAALLAPPLPGVRVVGVDVTELLVEGSRGLLVLRTQVAVDDDDDAAVAFEVAVHVQCRDGRIVGVTEYASDQYALDDVVGQ